MPHILNRKPSPNYPRMTLTEAIERISRVYKRHQTHAAAPEVIAQALRYTTLNGSSKGVIATLKQYGLLEAAGNGLRVSDQSVSILELPDSDPDRHRMLSTVILNPGVCAELHRGFGDELPLNAKLVSCEKGLHSESGRRNHSHLSIEFSVRQPCCSSGGAGE